MEQEPADRSAKNEDSGIDPGRQSPAEVPSGEEKLYDLVIPPGTPRSIIMEVSKKFDVELVERKEKLYFANMQGDERELLTFRGRLEVMQKVEPYFYQKMKEFIGDT
jgi:hypothetical protein